MSTERLLLQFSPYKIIKRPTNGLYQEIIIHNQNLIDNLSG